MLLARWRRLPKQNGTVEFELTSPTVSLKFPMLESTIGRDKRCGKAAFPYSVIWKGLAFLLGRRSQGDQQALCAARRLQTVLLTNSLFAALGASHLRLPAKDRAVEIFASNLQADALTGMGRCLVWPRVSCWRG